MFNRPAVREMQAITAPAKPVAQAAVDATASALKSARDRYDLLEGQKMRIEAELADLAKVIAALTPAIAIFDEAAIEAFDLTIEVEDD